MCGVMAHTIPNDSRVSEPDIRICTNGYGHPAWTDEKWSFCFPVLAETCTFSKQPLYFDTRREMHVCTWHMFGCPGEDEKRWKASSL